MSEVELLSEVGANYTRLRELLATGKWKEADDETREILLKVAVRESEGWLNENSFHKLPCTDLRTISFVWGLWSRSAENFYVRVDICEL
ncbi:GUN4 domain-containing protein [Aerosakkonema funiforme]|uniref:GUN4 domain-containing protein n=1 Tax=Aerosakkonema funiforme TaxID=1246630 RepID=UPI0035BA07F1